MILQAGLLEKFVNVPSATGLDVACFAGAVLISSAWILPLPRLSWCYGRQVAKRTDATFFYIIIIILTHSFICAATCS
ncbi:hypothetical protein NC653_006363 [Populus alba x Populus x berolinensis]|uniref:Uncharacterized protein n=1 Tax=Populus alba x Populus x berolinensis TaxID=444605 RepID=A0AAD6REH4_9ROSI|nr:hypothetical protein NC653_006363 [Populus alba x Populus x berolinensis]